MIRVTCNNCQQGFKIDDKHGGKKTKCPKCNEVILIPLSRPSNLSNSNSASTNSAVLCTKCLKTICKQEYIKKLDGETVCSECFEIYSKKHSKLIAKGDSNSSKKCSSLSICVLVAILLVIGLFYFIYDSYETKIEKHQRMSAGDSADYVSYSANEKKQKSDVDSYMDEINQQVVADCLERYRIAKRSGTAIDAYTQASLVAEAYLQAHDETNYRKWKRIVKEEAQRAGIE